MTVVPRCFHTENHDLHLIAFISEHDLLFGHSIPRPMFSFAAASRFVALAYLVSACILSFGMMALGVLMEGMRHAMPSPGKFDPYYFECCTPAFIFGFLFLAAWPRFPFVAVIVGGLVTAGVAVTWLVYEHRQMALLDAGYPPSHFTIYAAGSMVLGTIAAWHVRRGKFCLLTG